jgi:hypothetical protein
VQPAGGPQRPERGVSEVLGAVLMTGVVVLSISVAGAAMLPLFGDVGTSGAPLVDCDITADGDEVLITHGGGDRVDTAALRVVIEDASSGRTITPFPGGVGDGDGEFERGESVRVPAPPDVTEVQVFTSSARLCGAVITDPVSPTPAATPTAAATPAPTATATPTPTATATATPTATPAPTATATATPTATPTPTPTATPTATPTPSNQPPTAEFSTNRRGRSDNVELIGTPSSDPDGSVVSYRWDIGDDGTIDHTGEVVPRADVPDGTLVTLIVTDDDGATDQVTRLVTGPDNSSGGGGGGGGGGGPRR